MTAQRRGGMGCRVWQLRRRATRCCWIAMLLAFAMLQSQSSTAQIYPERPVKIVAGTAAGGQSDRLARLVAQGLERLWGQPIVVEARAGADGTIAAEAVAHAPADGYTLLLGGQSNLALVAAQGRPLRYDPVADFAPIGRIARVPLVLAINARNPATTLSELISVAKAAPGALTYGSTGMQSRLATELFKAAEGLDIVEIPYKGVPPALSDLLAARIDMVFFDVSIVAPHAEAGTLRLLAAAGARRTALAPTVPTLDELGFRGFRVEPWYGLVAPANTPRDVLARLRSGLAELRRTPWLPRQLQQLGYEPIDDSPEQFSAELVGDIERFAAIIKAAKLGIPR
jgi:tripartite-type tricarboxylate transporter receptor subunit TctC